MGVYFRGRDVSVAEQLLDGAQIGATIEQVTCEGMSQNMRADAFWVHTGRAGEFLEVLRESLTRQVSFGAG